MPTLDLIAFKTALIHAGAALVIPLLALRVVVSAREIRENIGFIALVIVATMAAYVAVARFNIEFPSIAGGVCGLVASVWLARRRIGLAPADTALNTEIIAPASLFKATLGLSRTTILSLQSAGGAMGNMICIHNIVAVCSLLGLPNEEGRILRQTFRPMLIYGVIVGTFSLIL